MSISHWGIFPGFIGCEDLLRGPDGMRAVWRSCDFDYWADYSLVDWIKV